MRQNGVRGACECFASLVTHTGPKESVVDRQQNRIAELYESIEHQNAENDVLQQKLTSAMEKKKSTKDKVRRWAPFAIFDSQAEELGS